MEMGEMEVETERKADLVSSKSEISTKICHKFNLAHADSNKPFFQDVDVF